MRVSASYAKRVGKRDPSAYRTQACHETNLLLIWTFAWLKAALRLFEKTVAQSHGRVDTRRVVGGTRLQDEVESAISFKWLAI